MMADAFFFFFLNPVLLQPAGILAFYKVPRGPSGLTDARENGAPSQGETRSFHTSADAGCLWGAFLWSVGSLPCQISSPGPKVRSSQVSPASARGTWLQWEPGQYVLFLLPHCEPWGMLMGCWQCPCCAFSAEGTRPGSVEREADHRPQESLDHRVCG